MIEERNEIRNFCLYSEDRNHRYLLARIWDEKKSIPLFISKCSGEADGIQLELTNTLITNNLYAWDMAVTTLSIFALAYTEELKRLRTRKLTE